MSGAYLLRCRCGTLQGSVTHPERGTRGVCYCRDCQAFAAFLGFPEGMLDDWGGTDVAAVRPPQVVFTAGVERLACMSLSRRGTLRWYASCCRTPIGNTPRDWRIPHVGLVHSCLDSGDRGVLTYEAAFGRVKLRLNRHGARKEPPRGAPVTMALAIARFLGSMAWMRLSGRYRQTPFFDDEGRPRLEPRALEPAERAALGPPSA